MLALTMHAVVWLGLVFGRKEVFGVSNPAEFSKTCFRINLAPILKLQISHFVLVSFINCSISWCRLFVSWSKFLKLIALTNRLHFFLHWLSSMKRTFQIWRRFMFRLSRSWQYPSPVKKMWCAPIDNIGTPGWEDCFSILIPGNQIDIVMMTCLVRNA